MMENHTDHLGHGHGHRPTPESGTSRQLMMPPFPSLPPQSQYPASDIPSTSRPSPAPVTTSSLLASNGIPSNRRSVADGTAMPLQTSPVNMHGGSSPESHAGGTGYTWGTHDSWAGRSPQHYGNRTPGALNQGGFFFQNMNTMPSTTAHSISPITATTPGDTLPSFHSSPATSMSHLSIDQATSNGNSNGILPPFRQNSTSYTPRPTPPLGRSSSFPSPAGTVPPYVPGISSMLPMSTMPSSTRPGLAAPISPLGSSGPPGPPGPPPPAPGPGRLSPYSSGHQQQYMHNLGNPGQPMALVSHYSPAAAAAAYGGHFGGMMFQSQQRQPDKPHQCDQCPTAFTRNHDLKRHKRIHWAVKPFPCDGCEKAFSRKDALKRHKLVKCCGKDGKDKRDGSPSSTESQGNSGDLSPRDPKR
ncbi:hypothetical protein FJTKL_02073 [Diaporthe vaccinii]|uniref:C2H2-type domain-containing protein n=2 Tax=Diaporthe vaccinii TaxID=105482 RepID=A0ABR4DZ50_9PEZI